MTVVTCGRVYRDRHNVEVYRGGTFDNGETVWYEQSSTTE